MKANLRAAVSIVQALAVSNNTILPTVHVQGR